MFMDVKSGGTIITKLYSEVEISVFVPISMWQNFSLNHYDPTNINGHWELCNEWHSLQTKAN